MEHLDYSTKTLLRKPIWRWFQQNIILIESSAWESLDRYCRRSIHLTIIPWVPVGYEMGDKQRDPSLPRSREACFARPNRVFSLTWPASKQIYWNKRKRLHKKRDTNMAAVSLFWATKMAAVTSCENTLYANRLSTRNLPAIHCSRE